MPEVALRILFPYIMNRGRNNAKKAITPAKMANATI
jgi:hypothetical protein